MKIGIDISQIAYEGTGTSQLVLNLVSQLSKIDKKNEYILFFSSMRKNLKSQISNLKSISQNFKIKTFRVPPTILDLLWNRMHILPIEWLIGDVDVFITSDWTEPPTVKAKKATILYDLIVYKYPDETDKKIVDVQRNKLRWVKRESEIIFCISEATKKDAMDILGIEEKRLSVIYPGT
ncbi:MAG: hypothetical protein HYW62_02415 [Candidatus Levybacteria bacterium]|nr:hypothetical protein [Candidatus Levybacteria bacterium]